MLNRVQHKIVIYRDLQSKNMLECFLVDKLAIITTSNSNKNSNEFQSQKLPGINKIDFIFSWNPHVN